MFIVLDKEIFIFESLYINSHGLLTPRIGEIYYLTNFNQLL